MTCFAIVLLGLTSLVSARSAFLSVPLTYATPLTPGTQITTDTGVLSNSEVVRRERVNLVNRDAARSIDSQARQGPSRGRRPSLPVNENVPHAAPSAPLGTDGRVVDTPEVAAARAAHAAAHVNEKIKLANEVARSDDERQDSSETNGNASEATLGPDGRVQDTPEVAAARAAHVAAHVNEKINLAKEAVRSNDALARVVNGPVVPLVLGNGVVAALVPVDADGRPLDAASGTAARDDRNPANDALKSVDALAIAGPALAYGRLVY